MIDYHVHSSFSCDCQTRIQDICEAAVSRGLVEIAICDHAEFTDLDECYGYLQPEAYMAEVRRCQQAYQGVLTIRAGIEIGEPYRYPDTVGRFLRSYEFDFVLGSLHFVDGLPDFSRRFFAGRSLEDGVRRYLEALAAHAAEGDYDVMSHIDIICRAVFRAFGLRELDLSIYESHIRRVLRILIERGKGVEVNTATTHRRMGSLGFTRQVLCWFRELGGTVVTVGSDAHTRRAVGAACDEAIAVVQDVGFDRLATFERRQVCWLPI